MFQNMESVKQNPIIYIVLISSIAGAYFLAAKLSFALSSSHDIVTIVIFAAEGIALGSVLFFGIKVWPGVFLGQLFVTLNSGMDIAPSVSISIINSFETIIAFYLFHHYRLDNRLLRLKDVVGLILLIVLVLQPFSAIFGNTVLLMDGIIQSHEYLKSLFSWWFGNVMGQLLFAPFTLLFLHNYKRIQFFEYLFYVVMFGIFIYVLEVEIDIENLSLLLTFTIPVVIMVNAYKGLFYGSTFAIIVAIVSSYSVYLGVGAFSVNSLLDNIININFFILTHISMVLISGALFEERKQTEYLLQMKVNTELKRNKEQQLLMFQQSRLAQMGEMIAMIAHQWRQPLNNLSLINQMIVSKYQRGKLDDDVVTSFNQKSKKLINHMSATIDDFRTFFKSDKEKQRFCVNESIEKVLNMTESMIGLNNIILEYDEKKSYYTYGYPNEFSQAILNLVSNAKDALIEKELDKKRIHIFIEESNETIVVNIHDNAGGVPEEILDKIFDPYFSTKENKNGTGLGLYMVKMIIIDHMYADITVSNIKDGANFKITLPKSL